MVQRVAQLLGLVFILIGLLGFVAGGMSMDADNPTMLLGLFAVNLLHNVVHLLFGIWGLTASRSEAGALTFARIGGAIYIILALVGLISPNGFGLVPLGGHDVWLHAVLGIVLVGTALSHAKKAPAAA